MHLKRELKDDFAARRPIDLNRDASKKRIERVKIFSDGVNNGLT
jgi:hypothetical protein